MGAEFDQIKRAYGSEQIRTLAETEGLVHRGSGKNRTECPGCRNGDPRGASVGETNGVGVWNCHRDERHRGSVLDFLALARGIDVPAAARLLENRAGLDAPSVDRSRPRSAIPKPPCRPPEAEVAEVWERVARPVLDVPEIASAWQQRGVDPGAIEDRNLARALPRGATLPAWAFGSGISWSAGTHRLVLPLFDRTGRIASLHARAAVTRPGVAKGLSPRGFEVAGLIFADPLAQLMLRGEATHLVRDTWVLIAEGAPDFLTAATQRSDADESAPAVLGVIAGSWTKDVAARVPDGTRVLVAVHSDSAGEKYAAAITDTLAGRCRVRRFGRGQMA